MKWPTMIVVSSSSEIDEHFHMIVAPLDLDHNTSKIVPYKLGSERFLDVSSFLCAKVNFNPPIPGYTMKNNKY